MRPHLLPALKLTALCLLFFSGLYTLALLGIAKLTPNGGNAATVEVDGRVYYTDLAQRFSDDRYFWSRPSAVGYNAAGSGGSNKGPTNPDLLAAVQARIDTFLVHDPGVARSAIPSELVTASGSGLDPHLSPAAARVQIARIAGRRGLDPAALEKLVDAHTRGPLLGLFGPSTVNVLELNLALDALH